MIGKSKWLGRIVGIRLAVTLLLMLTLSPAAAHANVIAGFYAHEFGTSFPHAFVTLKGTTGDGTVVDTNYGFTAASVTPAILMGSVKGIVETEKQAYVASSHRRFSVVLNDAQYAALMGVVTKWREMPGRSYDLGSRNCVHFVGEAAQAIGLHVLFEKALMKRPHSFLDNILRLNPGLHAEPSGK
jgi:hypothetical protein